MSVIITNMDIPKNCEECRFCNAISADNQAFVCDAFLAFIKEQREGRLEYCPLVELPDHGRLIDADSISEKIDNIWDGRPLSMLGCEILAMIEKEPTVIEAERSEE